jgi:hypothetical protein
MVDPIRPIGSRPKVVAPVDMRPLGPIEREAQKRAREEARKRRRSARSGQPKPGSGEGSGGLDVRA